LYFLAEHHDFFSLTKQFMLRLRIALEHCLGHESRAEAYRKKVGDYRLVKLLKGQGATLRGSDSDREALQPRKNGIKPREPTTEVTPVNPLECVSESDWQHEDVNLLSEGKLRLNALYKKITGSNRGQD
jgi:hypothetical protein